MTAIGPSAQSHPAIAERPEGGAGLGVSVIICCHNSARRLPQTLAHLASQDTDGSPPWEVIVVDNASTDDTAELARARWPEHHPAPLRVVYEPRLGLSNARQRGFSEAKYEVVGFVDDDNWVCAEWVRTAAEVMARQPRIGACGGPIEAVCEVSPPEWFLRSKKAVAPPPPRADAGDISETVGAACGAGLVVRRSAWRELKDRGFRFLLTDRHGPSLTAGGDTELCFALRLAGWRIWYEPCLRLRHFVPKERLDWNRWRRQARGAGMAYAVLALYGFASNAQSYGLLVRLRTSWLWQMLAATGHLLARPVTLLLSSLSAFGERDEALEVEVFLGRLVKLWEIRSDYAEMLRQIRAARWRQD